MQKTWTDEAWDDYIYWQEQDKKTRKRINSILKDIDTDPFSGLGKPEPLRHELQGCWSRRIDAVNRLVYKVEEGKVVILQCRAHYND